jgi:hypothetical protein
MNLFKFQITFNLHIISNRKRSEMVHGFKFNENIPKCIEDGVMFIFVPKHPKSFSVFLCQTKHGEHFSGEQKKGRNLVLFLLKHLSRHQ